MNILRIILGCSIALLACSATGCAAKNAATETSSSSGRGKPIATASAAVPSPRLYIYKTRADYSRNVPVGMDESRTRIVSYPAPSDLRIGGRLTMPTPLDSGYLLDNRGIGPNVAFLTYTYEEYSAFEHTPSLDELNSHILDCNPLTAIIDCGLRSDFKEPMADAVNEYIRTNGL